MNLKLKYKEDTIALAVEMNGGSGFTATIGDSKIEVTFARMSEQQMHLTVNGRQVQAFVAETPDGKSVMVDGRTYLLADHRASEARSRTGRANGPRLVTPPMPSVVTRILVAEGQAVDRGQGLMVVSAMKMDTVLTAPFAGVVSRINVAEGEKVAPKQVLVDIEPEAVDAAALAARGAT